MKKYCPAFIIPLLITNLLGKTITVSGKVMDKNNQPIQNVNVYTDTKGITTDGNGLFEFSVNKQDVIIFSHIGYKQIAFLAEHIPHDILLDKYLIPSNQILVKSGLSPHTLRESSNSISVMSQSEFRSGNDEHFQDLISQIPNITYASATSRPRYILIRGIGEISQFAGEGPPNYSVGYIIDDVDYSGIGSIGAVFDMAQLEVHRGPQTYAFGPNAMAGVINMQSLNPTPFMSGKTEIGVNSDQGNTMGVTFSNSLYRNAAFRITAYRNYTDGFIDNKYRKLTDTNKQDEKYLRIKLKWEPFSWLNMKLTNLLGIMQNGYDAWAPDNNGRITYTDYQGKDEITTRSFSLRTNLQKFNIDITSILSYSDNEMIYAFDGDWGNSEYWENDPYNWYEENFDYFSEETCNEDPGYYPCYYDWSFKDETIRNRRTIAHDLRISKLINDKNKIISGIYIKKLKETDLREGWLFGGQATDISTDFNITTISLYLNNTSQITKNTEFNIGTRFNQTKILYDGTGNTLDYTTWEPIPIKSLDTSITTEMIGLHSSIRSWIYDDLHVFTSFSRGYKAGGINQNPYLLDSQRVYDPEYNLNASVGFGYQKEKFDAQFTVFYMKRSNQQVRLSFQTNTDDPLSFDFFTANVTEGFNSGIETSIKYRLNNNLILNMNAGLLKNHVKSYTNPINPSYVYGNREPAHSPAFSYSFVINYFLGEKIHFSLESSGMDKFYFEDQYYQKSQYYNIFNASISLKHNKWNITTWGKNVLDEKYATKGYYFDLGIGDAGEKSYNMYGKPAHYGLTLQYTF